MIDPREVQISTYDNGQSFGGMGVHAIGSGITVMHLETGIGIVCNSERSQHANKEKALQLLESLLLAIKSEQAYNAEQEAFQQRASIPNKVEKIRELRIYLGIGLKESKDLVDRYGHLNNWKDLCEQEHRGGMCSLGDACVCGGDLPSIQKGCYNWWPV